MKKRNLKALITAFIFGLVALSTPSEKKFLNRLNQDYGNIHGTSLSNDQLEKIGSSSYKSYVLWSKYQYSFGSITVNYVGVLFMTFYLGNNTENVPSQNTKILSSL